MATSAYCSSSLALVLIVMVCAATGAFAATYQVGNNQRWSIPQSASEYTDWARGQRFVVGDTLVFNFATGAHDVLRVTSSSYGACNIQNPIASYPTGPATVNLTSSGTYYFICGVSTHCSEGNQKMTLTVSAATSAPSPPPTSGGPAPPPAATANPPASSTPNVPSSPGPSGAGTPPGSSGTPPGSGTPPRSGTPSIGVAKAAAAAVALAASVAALVL